MPKTAKDLGISIETPASVRSALSASALGPTSYIENISERCSLGPGSREIFKTRASKPPCTGEIEGSQPCPQFMRSFAIHLLIG